MKKIFCLLAGLALSFSGCGDADVCHVSGKVTYNGQPVKAGMISLEPADGKSQPHGIPITDGRYISTENSRIEPGKYIVRITAPDLSRSNPNANVGPNDPVRPAVPLVPVNWNVRSNLSLELKPGLNEANFSGEKMSPPKVEMLDPQ